MVHLPVKRKLFLRQCGMNRQFRFLGAMTIQEEVMLQLLLPSLSSLSRDLVSLVCCPANPMRVCSFCSLICTFHGSNSAQFKSDFLRLVVLGKQTASGICLGEQTTSGVCQAVSGVCGDDARRYPDHRAEQATSAVCGDRP